LKHLSDTPRYYEFSRSNEPRAWIKSGETLAIESEDALSGQIRKNGDQRDKAKMPYSNPVTGPICVEGAEPGDALAVKILEIRPTIGQCSTYTGPPRNLGEWLGLDCPQGAHVMPIKDGKVYWSEEITIPFTPMLGCLGTAPDWGSPTTGPAGPHGGNMDIVEVCPGNTIYLPVFVKGGYLYLGDAHAAQGHGELSVVGLEMPAETTITVELVKGKKLAGPRIESPQEIMTVVSGCPTERSIGEAYARLILWMEEEFGWNRWKAYDILTHVGQISLGYYGIGTVAAKINKRYLRPRG
jgi:acetamidase/formamidase